METPIEDPIKPAAPKPIELVLAEQANDAMQGGADPHAATDMLGTMLKHLKANPQLAQQANDALAHGTDPHAISGKIWEMANQPATAQYKPPLAERVVGNLAQAIPHAVMHPIDTAESMIGAPVKSFFDMISPGVGEQRPDPRLSKGGNSSGAAIPKQGDVYDAEHGGVTPGERAAGAAQTAANVAFPGIAEGVAKTIGKGALAKAAGIAVAGGTAGAAYDPSDPVAGGLTGAILAPTLHTAGKATGAVAGTVGSGILDAVGRPTESGPLVKLGPLSIGHVEGMTDRALTQIGKRASMDAQSGAAANVPAHPSLPALAVDRMGPNVQGYVEGMANRPGPARAIIQRALEGRQAQMRPAVTNAFDQATNTTAVDGEQLLKRLADEQSQRESAANVADAVDADAKANPGAPAHTPISAFETEHGPVQGNAIKLLSDMDKQGRTDMARTYGAARAATKGMPIESPTLDAINKTPVGKLAYTWAQQQMENRGLEMPRVANEAHGGAPQQDGLYQKLLKANGGDTHAATQGLKALGYSQDDIDGIVGGAPSGTHEVPDPQFLHFQKQYLAKLARLGVNDGAQGTLATQAQGAVQQWAKIRGELPPIWQEADQAAAEHFGRMDALNAGRNITRTTLSPAGAPRAAIAKSLQGLEERMGKAPDDQQYAFRVGARSALSDYLNSAKPAKVLAELQNPESALSRRVALATGDAQAPAKLVQRLQDVPQQIPAAPSVPAQSPESQAAQRGLDIEKHKVAPSGDHPERSLAQLDHDAAQMAPRERAGLQQGAAQATRGRLAASSAASPGQALYGAPDPARYAPERVRQMRYAFPSEQAATEFQGAVSAWDAAQQQLQTVLKNSRTGLRGAEGSGMGVTPTTLMSGAKAAVKSIVEKAAGKLKTANQQRLETEAARLLMSPQLRTLPPLERASAIRSGLLRALHQGALVASLQSGQPQ